MIGDTVAIVKGSSIDSFVARPPEMMAAALFYGSDSGSIRERAMAMVRAVAGRIDDPFNVVRLDEAAIASDPGRLADEFNAFSMMGGRRVIWIAEADKAFHKAVEPLLRLADTSNVIIAEAGNLGKTVALRSLFEKAGNAFAIPCYQDNADDLHELIRAEFNAVGAKIEPDAEKYLVSLLAADRLLSRSEIAKLALYGIGHSSITLADVEAVCADASSLSLDDAIDAVFEGDLEGGDEAFSRLMSSGHQAGTILTMIASHIARLQQLNLEMARGRSSEEVVRSARPPVFFKRADHIARQLRLWDLESLTNAGSSVATAASMGRQLPALDEAIVNRVILSLTRNAKAQKASRI